MQRNEPGVRADIDSEFLHDYRVAVRRTRSALSQIKDVLPEDKVEHFKTEFGWLGQMTGPTRDLDVYLLQFEHLRNQLPEYMRDRLIRCATIWCTGSARSRPSWCGRWTPRAMPSCEREWPAFLDKPTPKRDHAGERRAAGGGAGQPADSGGPIAAWLANPGRHRRITGGRGP